MELHDFAGDGGFEGAIVIYRALRVSIRSIDVFWYSSYEHGRSGSVAFPRTKLAPARPACLEVEEATRKAERAVEERRSIADMVASVVAVQ